MNNNSNDFKSSNNGEPNIANIEKYIKDKLEKCNYLISENLIPSFEGVKIIAGCLLIRSYWQQIGKLQEYETVMSQYTYDRYLNEAVQFYRLELNVKESIKNIDTIFLNIMNELSDLPYTHKSYITIFSEVMEESIYKYWGYFDTNKIMKKLIADIVKILGINKGKVVQLTCGLGTLLNEVSDNVKCNFYEGIEIIQDISNISNILYTISEKEKFNIICEDVLIDNNRKNEYSLVLVDPPITKVLRYGKYTDFKVINMTNRRSFEMAELIIEKAIEMAEPGGYILGIMPQNILFSSGSKVVREFIMDSTIIEAIISLPDHILNPYSSVNVSLMVLRKVKQEDIKPENVFLGQAKSVEDIDDIIEAFSIWKFGGVCNE